MKKIETIKKLVASFSVISLLFMVSCSSAPKIEDVENSTQKNVEALFTEDNNEELTVRMDDYFLTEQVDKLTYKGILKGTAFYSSLDWDDRQSKVVQVPDSTKISLYVTIKYLDKKYSKYTVLILENK